MKRLYIGSKSNAAYELGTKKSGWGRIVIFPSRIELEAWGFKDGFLKSFCAEDFERITGIKLKVGEIRKVKITVELLD